MSVKKYLTLNGLAYFLNKIKSTMTDELDSKADDSDVVHKSGNETVGGNKTFVNGTTLNDWLYFTNALVTKGTIPQSSVTPYRIYFGSGTNYANSLFNIDTTVSSTGAQILTFRSAENVVNGSDTRLRIIYDPTLTQPKCVKFQGDCLPVVNNTYECGNNGLKWKSINGINPGALSLPDLSNGIDISGYITDLTGASNINKFTPTVNGWISIGLSSADFIEIYIPSSLMGGSFTKSTINNYSQAFMPVIANKEVRIALKGSSIGWAKFYPCQGNV